MFVLINQAHWCGAGEDDDEGVDDDFPHRSNQILGAAIDSHSLMLIDAAAAEFPVSAFSSAVTNVPFATDSSPVLASLAASHNQPQPISPLPLSPSLTARVPSSPIKTVLGIKIDSSAAASAAATVTTIANRGSTSGGTTSGGAKDAPLPSLVVRASLGATRPLQTLTPVSSVGAHLNLLGSPSTVALSALSNALASASAAAADGSGSSDSASPMHRGGCVSNTFTHAFALVANTIYIG
jgi:hypothetical protein